MNVLKRNKQSVNYDTGKVLNAVWMAIKETEWLPSELSAKKASAQLVAENVEKAVKLLDIHEITIDQLQNIVQRELELVDPNAGERYILYRNYRDISRLKRRSYRLLSDEFISPFKKMENPMAQLGSFVFYRTYSRWVDEEHRREYWWETIRRAVEYNVGIDSSLSKEAAIHEAQSLFKSIFGLKQFLSGRTFWVGNTEVSNKYPTANFNCAFTAIKSVKDFRDVFYLLMVGAGVGISVMRQYTSNMEMIRSTYELRHLHYAPVAKEDRVDHTSMNFLDNSSVIITVGDSKEGWALAIDMYFELLTSSMYKKIKSIQIEYNNVRPKGEKLDTFGGTASGHESLLKMFSKIDKVIKSASARENVSHFKMRPIDAADICNIIGENVVSGGVRRTAEMIIFDEDDQDMINAKQHLYTVNDKGEWVINQSILHRQMSNNSIMYMNKPSREVFSGNFAAQRYSGEPGWINGKEAQRRNPKMKGLNPCGEILLDDKGLCNLTTINVMSFVSYLYESTPGQPWMESLDGDYIFGATGALNLGEFLDAIALAVRSSYRMTLPDLELPEWDRAQKAQALLGLSMTGLQDAFNALGFDWIQKKSFLIQARDHARAVADAYSAELGMKSPDLVTTIKPEGTLSQVAGVSSGIHFSHSPFFIRRVRITATDPLVKVAEELGWPVFPEVGQDPVTCNTKYVEFPCKAPKGRTKNDVSAIEQLEEYKLFMETYVDHNASITVHVKANEWEEVEQWVWDNWDSCVALSFLSLNDNFFEAMPYESITEDEYFKRLNEMAPFVPSLINKYAVEAESSLDTAECELGICPIR